MTRPRIWYRQVVTATMLDLLENKLETPLEEAFVGRLVQVGNVKTGRLEGVTIASLAEWMRVDRPAMRRCIRALEGRGIIRCQFFGHGRQGWVELVPFDDVLRRSHYVYRVANAQDLGSDFDRRTTSLRSDFDRRSWENEVRLLDSHDSPTNLSTSTSPASTGDLASVLPLHEPRGKRASQRGRRHRSAGSPRRAQLAAHHIGPGLLGSRDPRALGDILDEAWRSL